MDNANSTANLLDYYDWYQASVEFSRTVSNYRNCGGHLTSHVDALIRQMPHLQEAVSWSSAQVASHLTGPVPRS